MLEAFVQRANFDVSIKQAAISILGKGGGKIRCKSRENGFTPFGGERGYGVAICYCLIISNLHE